MKRFILIFSVAMTIAAGARSEVVIADVFARQATSLNGKWHVIVDPYDTGYFDYRRQPYDKAARPSGGFFLDRQAKDKTDLVEYNFNTSPTLNVPGDWNSQDEKLFYYEGSVWYRTRFDVKKSAPGHRLFVYFGAANYEADVYLNGQKLGKHTGGFTPFAYEITELAKEKNNSLVVRVNNNRHADGVPTVNTDWWNYGGLTRDVLLVETPATFISNFRVRLKSGTTNTIEGNVQLDGAGKNQSVKINFPSLKIAAEMTADENGVARFELTTPNLALWSPEQPVLNDVEISSGDDQLKDRVGFRTITTGGTDILLNGHKVFLRGICIHEENPLRGGRAWSENDARLLLGWAKKLNCNFVRLAHYPHNEHMARLADEMGIMVWEETPVYWTIQWTNAETLANAKKQLGDEILRDQNRASVIVWSVANETPVGEARTKFLKSLVDEARALDGTRLVSAAMEVRTDPDNPNHKIVDDPFGEFTDLCSFNEYTGWYDGLPDKIDRLRWSIKYDKPVVISEFGADAKQGFHSDALTRFSEEYQADVYKRTLPMLEKIPGFSGCTPWILCDFRSPRRPLPEIQDGWNIKGLIGHDGKKKMAFAVLKNFYDEKAKAGDANNF
ncbi:MAG TPA: glycoside hydrolase family 2 TIM barrel-domain containing protein [Candidatus Dormibacteraeota bacterium]|nr:glycoside hydrolase family 2 TIM barrel-domain containing protein [Candidatus Dormibacteraeota bacterium]